MTNKPNLKFLQTDLRIKFIVIFGTIAFLAFIAPPLILSLLVCYYLWNSHLNPILKYFLIILSLGSGCFFLFFYYLAELEKFFGAVSF
jgi:hypothetical protein